MSTVRIHQKHSKNVVKGVVSEYEEHIIDGDKGLKFKLFTREGDNKERIVGKLDENGKYRLITIKNAEKKEETDLTLEELLKLVKKNKALQFVTDFMGKGSKKGGAKKTSKKVSKKTSKKRPTKKN